MPASDEDAFLRAILAAPADDAPRLVFADWLEERDDPRGVFLRAEAARASAVHSSVRADSALRKLIVPLDPLWVARVSRPPFGVCCNHLTFKDPGPEITLERIEQVERRLGFNFPEDFRAYLLNCNGGLPDPAQYLGPNSDDPAERDEVEHLAGIRLHDGRPGFDPGYEFIRAQSRTNAATRDLFPVGNPTTQDDLYFLGVEGPRRGRFFLFSDFTHNGGDPEHVIDLAPSFAAFLGLLTSLDPPWVRLIETGDTKGFANWLKEGGDPDEENPSDGYQPLQHATFHRRTAIAKLLLEAGASRPRGLAALARQYDATGIIKLLESRK